MIAAILLIVGAAGDLTGRWRPGWKRVPLDGMVRESGFAYVAPLAESEWSSAKGASEALVLEDGKPLGPGNSEHGSVRNEGRGRFSFWEKSVYLSSSDNRSVLTNGRIYEAWGPPSYARVLRWALVGFASLSTLYLGFLVAAPRVNGFPSPGAFLTRVLRSPKLWTAVLAAGSALVVPMGLELWLRLTTPFTESTRSSVFDPEVGFRFAPNSVVRQTNHLDFWTSTQSNSLGFLDNEPIRRPGDCHITFIGDSFVEAAQVTMGEKLQRVVEAEEKKLHPEWRLTTSAFGYSGTGQINQLPFYDKYGKGLAPRLVVLVFVSNDFANNSPLLESLRNGWRPDAAPRLFARRSEETGEFTLVPISRDWAKTTLESLPIPGEESWHMRLKKHSRLYRWAFANLSLHHRSLSSLDGPSFPEQVLANARQLREDPRYAREMKDWSDRYAEKLEGFFDEDPPLRSMPRPSITPASHSRSSRNEPRTTSPVWRSWSQASCRCSREGGARSSASRRCLQIWTLL